MTRVGVTLSLLRPVTLPRYKESQANMDRIGDDLPDFELVRRMAEQSTDFTRAREAWGILYLRHHRSLMQRSTANHGYLLGLEGVKDVVQDAFMKAFDAADTFNHTELCDPDLQGRKFRGWVSRIIANLVSDRFRGQPEETITDDIDRGGVDTHTRSVDETASSDSLRLELLEAGLQSLSDVEQTILRGTMFWWRPDQPHQHMPHAALSQLCEQTGKTAANVRQIRLRAIRKLQQYVTDRFRQ